MKQLKILGILLLFALLCSTASADTSYNYATGELCADGSQMIITNNDNAHIGTYQEIIDFIQVDKTNENEYDVNNFHCVDFSKMLHDNSEAAGIRCAVVNVKYDGLFRHAIVAYPLEEFDFNDPLQEIDYLYIDPQSDGVARVEIGEEFQVWKIGENDCYFELPEVEGLEYIY